VRLLLVTSPRAFGGFFRCVSTPSGTFSLVVQKISASVVVVFVFVVVVAVVVLATVRWFKPCCWQNPTE
jgi:hypothetical protein